jgi:hypothetical protein
MFGSAATTTEALSGRLRSTDKGEWIFTVFTGQNCVVGIELGFPTPTWCVDQSTSGLHVLIDSRLIMQPGMELHEQIVLADHLPTQFIE